MQLPTTNQKVFHIEGIVPVFYRVGEQHRRTWFTSFGNLAIDLLLVAVFIDQFIRRIVPRERKILPWNLWPVENTATKSAIGSIHADVPVFSEEENLHNGVLRDEFILWCVARQIAIHVCTKVVVFFSFPSAQLMTNMLGTEGAFVPF